MITKYQKRLEEGYDLYDPQYEKWKLEMWNQQVSERWISGLHEVALTIY